MSERLELLLALGAAVRQRRQALGLTQEQLSLRSGIHQRWISNLETGVRNPSYGSIRRLAEAMEVALSELIAEAERIEAADTNGP